MRFDPATASCEVLTCREGVLSAVGHDLCLQVTRFTIDVDDAGAVRAWFDPGSLRVVGALRDGVADPRAIGDADRASIESAARRDVLEVERHPDVCFTGAIGPGAGGAGLAVTGTLTLHGRTHPLAVRVCQGDGGVVADAVVRQPDFGIRPYRALLGALRVGADVVVRVAVPSPRS